MCRSILVYNCIIIESINEKVPQSRLIEDTVKLKKCEHLGTRAKAFTLGDVQCSHLKCLFLMTKIQMGPGKCVPIRRCSHSLFGVFSITSFSYTAVYFR